MIKHLAILAILLLFTACGDDNTKAPVDNEPVTDDTTVANDSDLTTSNDDTVLTDDAATTDDPETDDIIVDDDTPTASSWKMVTAGRSHTCAISSDGMLYCWGDNSYGGLGDGTTGYETMKLSPVKIGNDTWSAVSAGDGATCAIRATDQKLYCWGGNSYGQLGDGTIENRSVPVKIGDDTWESVAVGVESTCGITTTGGLYCWGYNLHGQLGDGSTQDRNTPGKIGSETWTSVAMGEYHTCAIKAADDSLYCWGYNTYGELGDGTSCPSEDSSDCADKHVPTKVGEAKWATITAGGYNSCGIEKTTGTLYCWGDNVSGQIGDGGSGYDAWQSTPTKIGTEIWSGIGAAMNHTCGITTTDALYCWGMNTGGELGIGTDACPGDGDECEEPTPVKVGDGLWQAVSANREHSCGITMEGSLYCWGGNESGNLGDGTTEDRSTPTLISDPL